MNYEETNAILDKIQADSPTVAGLVFLYMWDYIRDVFRDIEGAVKGDSTWGDYSIKEGVTLETVWTRFQENMWGGFDVDGGNIVEWLEKEELIIEWDEQYE